jgi:hypothetical protein
MAMTQEPRPSFRTKEGWAISVLLEAGAIRECEEHGWMRDRADAHARDHAQISPGRIRRQTSLQMPPRRRSARY